MVIFHHLGKHFVTVTCEEVCGNIHMASGRLSTQHFSLRALFLAPNETATSQSSTRNKTANSMKPVVVHLLCRLINGREGGPAVAQNKSRYFQAADSD